MLGYFCCGEKEINTTRTLKATQTSITSTVDYRDKHDKNVKSGSNKYYIYYELQR